MANEPDFGHFGKGLEGYAHYNAAFERNFGKGDNGGGGKKSENGGCLSVFLLFASAGGLLTVILR